jgi:spore coat protein CotH
MRSKFVLFLLAALLFPVQAFAQSQADFFDPNNLQEIRLEIRPNDWATLKQNYLLEDYYACDFHWIFKGKDIGSAEIGIRSRGRGSRSGVKPSLRVDFNRYESGQTFLGLKSVVLRANTQDASMMHERVSMELFRKMGLAAPRETHTKLYVNDQYVGLYTIVESLDKNFLKTNFGEDGGYLYSYDYNDAYLFEDRGPDPATYSPLPFKPETNTSKPNPGPIAVMVQTINKSSDAQFQAQVSQYIELTGFLTQVAVENFVAEQDGIAGDYGMNNFYIYRFDGKNLHKFIPWDKSNTFWSKDWPILHNMQENVLTRRALATPELLAIYRNALARAAEIAGGPGGWFEQEINKEYKQIQEAAYADPVKLCDPGATGGLRGCTNEEFDAEVAYMIEFARQRAIDVQTQLFGPNNVQNFTTNNLGGYSITATGASNALRVGYARIQNNAGSTTPSGLAIFSLRTGETVFTEAGVPASPLIQSGRIYAEVSGAVNTGLAIANPNDQAATLNFYFTDASGRDFGQGTTTIPANGQIAQFLNQAPFNSGTLASGAFTFTSSVPVAAIALRGLTNERSEFLITTLPVAPTTAQSGNVTFPHFADGGGWTTQVVLVNPGDQTIAGTLQFLSQGSSTAAGQPLVIATADGQSASSFNYSIPAHSSYRLRTAGSTSAIRTGSVRVTPASNNGTPSGVGIFSFRNAGITVTEAGVPAGRATSAFRLYAESSGDFSNFQAGSIQTGIAVANSTASTAAVTFELTNLDGTSTGLTGTVSVPANGQAALFLYQVPGLTLPTSFKGVLRISGPSGIAVVGLRGRYNERGDFLITTTPPVAEDEPTSQAEMLFPHIVEGGGYTTQFILFSGKPGQASSGALKFLNQAGQPLILSLR